MTNLMRVYIAAKKIDVGASDDWFKQYQKVETNIQTLREFELELETEKMRILNKRLAQQ